MKEQENMLVTTDINHKLIIFKIFYKRNKHFQKKYIRNNYVKIL